MGDLMERRAALLLTLIALPASGLADTPEYTANDVVWGVGQAGSGQGDEGEQ